MVETGLGRWTLHSPQPYVVGQQVIVLIRPEAARLGVELIHEGECIVDGTVRECSFRGSQSRLKVQHASGLDLVFEFAHGAMRLPGPGEPVSLALRPEAISLLVEESHGQAGSA